MKLDIEGHDEKALRTFFEDASEALHPKLLIVETGLVPNLALIDLCKANNYAVDQRSYLNTIFKKT